MKRIAVIGAGISGLAAAYLISRRHQVWLFERDSRLGGHTHTVRIETATGEVALDTGFLVHNDATYPNLVRLFCELGVATQPSDMSFSVSCAGSGIEYSSRGALGCFAQPRNLIRAEHVGLLRDIVRFNREAPQALADGTAETATLESFVRERRYSGVFVDRYLVPMTSAIWSASRETVRSFPMQTLIRFMQNHGMLSLGTQVIWRVVRGGSDGYIRPLTAPLRDRIETGAAVESVRRNGDHVAVTLRDRPPMTFDEVVFACHGDQVLPLLADASDGERDVFSAFTTTPNQAVLHTDARVLPVAPRARASWNYRLEADSDLPPSVTYDLNRLQGIRSATQYCVTLNPRVPINEAAVLRRIEYRHPQFDLAAIAAQRRWAEVSGHDRTHFCGAYWRYGFHEDGLMSAQRVAASLGVRW
ncbi:MAG: FAD-dependent oxidoreductase [Acidobacteriota bacterium]